MPLQHEWQDTFRALLLSRKSFETSSRTRASWGSDEGNSRLIGSNK